MKMKIRKEEDETEKRKRAAYDMIYLIACNFSGQKPEPSRMNSLDIQALYSISRFHSLTALIFIILEKFSEGDLPDTELIKKWKEEKDKVVRKNILLDKEREDLFVFCEQRKIWYLPLKGIVLKDLYPQTGMRQMADNDILFDRKFQEDIYQWFTGRGYESKNYKVGNHDCYYKEPVYNFEMHTSLFGEVHNPLWTDYYRKIEAGLPVNTEARFRRYLSNEDFYVYITCHSYKHFSAGGTGLRTLTDCYVYLRAKGSTLNWKYIEAECKKLGISEYEYRLRKLTEKIFCLSEEGKAETLTEAEENLLEYILWSGTYGTQKQRIQNILRELSLNGKVSLLKSKWKYIFQRAFPNTEFMDMWTKIYCPRFYGKTSLYPIIKVWRILYKGSTEFGKTKRELKTIFKC